MKQITPKPIENFCNYWKIWGIPSSLDWWQKQTALYANSLTQFDDKDECGGQSCFASLVVAAIEEVELWIKAGVNVTGRTWVDIGGSNGYYAIALKLLGAKCVTLLDVEPPCKWAIPVLDAVGVDCINGAGETKVFNNVNSIALLYVPDLKLCDVFQNYPDLTMAVVSSDMFNDDYAEIVKWRSCDQLDAKRHFTIGEGMAIFSHDPHEMDDDIMCYFGDKIMDKMYVSCQLSKIIEEYSV